MRENYISRNQLREQVRKILVGTLLEEDEKIPDSLLDTVIKYYFPMKDKEKK